MSLVVKYSKARAIGAIGFPLLLLAVPLGNLLINPADFRMRWLNDSATSGIVALALLWFIYALWPSAFRFLSGGPDKVLIEHNKLILSTGAKYDLREASSVEILRPWLQHPRVTVQFPRERVVIETAYQVLGERKSPEAIAAAIADSTRR